MSNTFNGERGNSESLRANGYSQEKRTGHHFHGCEKNSTLKISLAVFQGSILIINTVDSTLMINL